MANNSEKKLNGTVIVTYRCNARCSMCNRYKAPSKPEEEISIETIKKLPKMYFTNITGGEPFIRTDLKDIVRELYKKSDRIVISTNGFFTDRIVDLCKEFPQIGIRISIEGLEQTNNEIRGLQNGYQRGYGTLKKLREMGMKDVGFGMTVQDKNAPDLVPLYKISNEMGMEFATASLHNSFYFVEAKNIIHDRPMVAKNFENLVNELLRSNSPKKWFRAYFNHGLINYIYGQNATFTVATWTLKKIFSGNVNREIGGFSETLFLHPTSPYWYLYALFFIFLVTPTFNSVKAATVRLGTFQLSDIFYNTVGGVVGGLVYYATMKARKRL